jgi:anti-anti-sigma regulatory factor
MENNKIKISSSTDRENKGYVIILEGNLSIQHFKKIKNKVLNTLAISENVKVVMKNITDIDLTVFQIFYSLKKNDKNIVIPEFTFDIAEPVYYHMKSSSILKQFKIFSN